MGQPLGVTGLKQHNEKFPLLYRGKVLDNLDPSQLGRIKIRVYPMFAGITDGDSTLIPWATPAMGLNVGAGLGFGTFCVPDVGANVWVFFEMGDIYQPVYFAEATDGLKGLPTSRISGTDPEDYPLVRVMRTQNGIQIKINDYNDEEDHRDIRVDHPSGSWVEFYPDGKATLHTTTEDGTVLIETDEAQINLVAKINNIYLNPGPTKRSIVNALSHTVVFKGSGTLNGDDGGLVCVSGSGTINVPAATAYEGLMYKFKRLDDGYTVVNCPPAVDDLTYFELGPAVGPGGAWAFQQIISNGVQWLKA